MNASIAAAIVAHPDDEVLCCGATLRKLASQETRTHVLILATGIAARGTRNQAEIDALRLQAKRAAAILGVQSVDFENFRDNRMDSVDRLDVVKAIEAFLARTGADTVFTHHPGDINVDHGVVAHAVMTAARPLPGSRVRRIWSGEVLSSSEWGIPQERFVPQSYVDVTQTLPEKIRALSEYVDEIRPFPHPRSREAVEHLARLRGAEAGFRAAEAFVVLREIVP